MEKQNHVVNRLTWIAGIVAMSLGFAVVSSKVWSSRVGTVSIQDTIGVRVVELALMTNGIVRKRIQSMGDISRDGVILNSYEYPSGLVSNIYVFSAGNSITQIVKIPTSERWIGTKKYEDVAEKDFKKNLLKDPAVAEIKSILDESPAARDSGRFYSGLRQLVVLSSEMLNVRRRRKAFEAKGGDGVTFIPQHRYITEDDWSRAFYRDRLEQQNLQLRCRERLEKLYGPIPDEMFQRLMSVKVLMVPDPLPDIEGE
jgi:hypothetical protein